MESQPARIYEPLIVPASLDPEAVKICRRLKRYGHEAYLVGGCVRDLSLGHIPKDFDVATSARPRQIKRLFRNARIIGRRFKLVHIQFGEKIIEVSTFRKNPNIDAETAADIEVEAPSDFVEPLEANDSLESAPPEVSASDESEPAYEGDGGDEGEAPSDEYDRPARGERDRTHDGDRGRGGAPRNSRRSERPSNERDDDSPDGDGDGGDEEFGDGSSGDLMIRRDNVFGSAQEDAVRRDFTVNALFYDVDENVVLDYVGGAEDLATRTIRTIGDPAIRFQEDPVRILRAIKFAARLGFEFDPATFDAMTEYSVDLSKCAPPRLTEELLKILSCGASAVAFDLMRRTGVLEIILPEIHAYLERQAERVENDDPDALPFDAGDRIRQYLEIVDHADRGRRSFGNATLLCCLLVGSIREAIADPDGPRDPGMAADRVMRPFAARTAISRRDAFRVKQIVVAQSRFLKPKGSRRRRRVKPIDFVRRDYFKDSLDFFRIESHVLQDHNEDEIRRWLDVYYGHLRSTNPQAYHRAKLEAPFDDFTTDQEAEERSHRGDSRGQGDRARRDRPHHESGKRHPDDSDDSPVASEHEDGGGDDAPDYPVVRARNDRGNANFRSDEGDAEDDSPPPESEDAFDHDAAGAPTGDEAAHPDDEGGGPAPFGRHAPTGEGDSNEGRGRRGRRRRRGRGRGRDRERDGGGQGGSRMESPEPRPNEESDSAQRPSDRDARGPRGERPDRGPRNERSPHSDRHRDDRNNSSRRGHRDPQRQRDARPEPVDSENLDLEPVAGSPSSPNDDPHAPAASNDESRGSGQGNDDRRGRRRRRRGRGRGRDGAERQGPAQGPSDNARHGGDRNRRGPPPEVVEIHEEEDPVVEIDWHAPFGTVDDPGPISVIRTGVDQTEKKGGRRRRRKLDGAARELSKEVEDQPALQAFKMIEGDPRGHEATRPRKQKRRIDDPKKNDREPPFDMLRDFESVEQIFDW